MCWKYEWAMAINNIGRAIEHIERAQKKLEARLGRNQKNLERLQSNPRYNYPTQLGPVKELINKNSDGINKCKDMISTLKQQQDLLFRMVHTYAIKHKEPSQTVYELMGKYPRKLIQTV